jgi:hypothetical protein
MRANLILTAAFCWISVLSMAQNPNPFELLWRIDGKITASPVPTPPAEAAPVEITPVETPVTTPKPAELETTIVSIPDPIVPDEPIDTIGAISPAVADTTVTAADSATVPDPIEEKVATPPAEDAPLKTEPTPPAPKKIRDLPSEPTPLVHVLIFGLLFSLLAWVLSLNRDILKKVYRAALNENFSALLFREQRFATTQYLYYIIYFVFFITGGMFLYLIGREFGWSAWVFRSIWSSIGLTRACSVRARARFGARIS